MTVKSAQVWSGLVVTRDATGALAAPSVGPAGTLYVDGVANGAGVTVSGANPYKWTVTLPALTAGQCVSMYLTATISTIATATVVAEDVADTSLNSDLATTIGAAGAGLTALGDARLANLDAAVSSRATPGDVQVSLAVSATEAAAAAQNHIAIRFFYAVSITITSTLANDLAAAGSKLYLAVKEKESDSDDDALVFIERTEGLLRLAKLPAADPTKGSLTLGGASGAWTILFWLDQTVTGSLAPWKGNRYCEIKHVPASGDPLLVTTGKAILSYGIVQANA